MLVWNEFLHDARVTREAELLISRGAHVQVTAILSKSQTMPLEVTCNGIQVHRVARQNHLAKIPLLLRNLARRVQRLVRRQGEPLRPSGTPRWWQFDRHLAFLLEELAVNWRLYRSAAATRPTVVHAHDVNTLVPAWLAARRSGARLVYDAHEISADREGYGGRIWLIKLVERWLGNHADGRITTTQARADWFRKVYGYPDMTVLQNRPVRSIADGSTLIRDRFHIPADQPVVLYQGGLQWGRGLSNLLEAMRGLPRGHLVFVGDGVQRASLQQAAADIADRVHFVGQVPLAELPAWTASADIGVQTLRNTCLNHYTTDSNKLFEYVMGGLPVVASDFPEIRAIVTAYKIGILVDPEDVESIRCALARLLDDESYRQRLADNSRRARDHLDWASQAPKLLSLYRAVLS